MHKIKYVVMDVDGTLTNGQINIGQNGELFKSFYCRDGLAILHAEKAGIIPIILTSRVSKIVEERSKELKIKYILQGASDEKIKVLDNFVKYNHISYGEIAYIGDDVNDIDCMKLCYVVGCPSDAVPEVKEICDYICTAPGGRGAVREFIEWLIREDAGLKETYRTE